MLPGLKLGPEPGGYVPRCFSEGRIITDTSIRNAFWGTGVKDHRKLITTPAGLATFVNLYPKKLVRGWRGVLCVYGGGEKLTALHITSMLGLQFIFHEYSLDEVWHHDLGTTFLLPGHFHFN